jgi:hypothetical protein
MNTGAGREGRERGVVGRREVLSADNRRFDGKIGTCETLAKSRRPHSGPAFGGIRSVSRELKFQCSEAGFRPLRLFSGG